MGTIAHYRKSLMIPVGQFHDTPIFPFPTSVQGLCHTVGGNHHRNLTVDQLLCGNRRIYNLRLFRCCKLKRQAEAIQILHPEISSFHIPQIETVISDDLFPGQCPLQEQSYMFQAACQESLKT